MKCNLRHICESEPQSSHTHVYPGTFLQSVLLLGRNHPRSPTRWMSGQLEWFSSNASTDARYAKSSMCDAARVRALTARHEGWPLLFCVCFIVSAAVWSQSVPAGHPAGKHHPQSHGSSVSSQTAGQHRGQGNALQWLWRFFWFGDRCVAVCTTIHRSI